MYLRKLMGYLDPSIPVQALIVELLTCSFLPYLPTNTSI